MQTVNLPPTKTILVQIWLGELMLAVADLGGAEGRAPPAVQFPSFPCSFRENIMPNNRLAPPRFPTELAPSLLENLDPPLVCLVCLCEGFTAFVPESLFTAPHGAPVSCAQHPSHPSIHPRPICNTQHAGCTTCDKKLNCSKICFLLDITRVSNKVVGC